MREAPIGCTLCREGDSGQEFFVLVDGEAIVTVCGGEVAVLGPGSFFGEMALLDAGRRVATVITLSDARLLVVPSDAFDAVLAEIPRVSRRIVTAMTNRLRMARRASGAPPDRASRRMRSGSNDACGSEATGSASAGS